MTFKSARSKLKEWLSNPIAWVMMGGLAVRLYSAGMRTIVAPDGAQYVYQASALLNKEWSGLLTCKLTYLSPLPIFIAAAFTVCRDWIVAAQSVNVLFGWATLFPLYQILRRLFSRNIGVLTVLIYALMPFLVDGSGNVIRGPMFWFFLSSGMLFFLRQWDEGAKPNRFRTDLLTSLFLFLLATWCRIEGVVFLATPFVYLCLTRTDRKLQRCFIFIMPMMAMGLLAVGAVMISGADVHTALRIKQVFGEATQFASNYQALESWIKGMYAQLDGINAEFLHRSRDTLGLIPLVVIFQYVMEGVFYPFALLFLSGILGIRKRCLDNRRMGYFAWQSLAGLLVLYIHTLQTWIVSYRFLAVLVFPGCVFMAAGVEKMIHFLQNRRQWPLAKAMIWSACALIIFGLPKNLIPQERDKAVYRQAARIMAQRDIAHPSARIAGFNRSRALEWIILYAHRGSPSIPCSMDLGTAVSSNYEEFVADLDSAGIRYFLYEKRYWPDVLLDLPAAPYQQDFRLLGQWQHSDSDRFMLFERIFPTTGLK